MNYRIIVFRVVAVAILSLSLSAPAHAVLTTFFGEDLGAGDGPGHITSYPNSNAARDEFFSNLVGVGTENFESFADFTAAPLGINFPGAGTATMTGSGSVRVVTSGTIAGRFPISGSRYWDSGDDFSITFDSPVAAFGFYGIDIGDINGQLTLTLDDTQVINIGNTILSPGGTVVYFGLIETAGFTSISFGSTATLDVFAFDDMTLGSLDQVINAGVPEPGTLFLLGSGLIGLGFIRRRKNIA